ncbi:kinase-like domain-containing protein [Chaetomidium leptoderma]|uniref:Kinase-like domain-containing protein n=1 Tax=Chaetomidium leptoderma TaxID=669021 RepID=A0AAN6ZVC3_9PEZI|nr:kinase-like domain-containing protein [Chaetomidium leptoderma]
MPSPKTINTLVHVPFEAPQTPRLAGRVTFEDPNLVRKRGDAWRLRREVEAMDYVRRHTSLLIPTIMETSPELDTEYGEKPAPEGWILMERLPGVELGVAWPNMSEESREETIRQLRSCFDQLHQLRPDGAGWIGSFSGGPAYDHRLDNRAPCGPFSTVGDFHDYLVAPVKRCPRPDWVSKYRNQLPDSHSIRFAHADLSWENILLDPETGTVSGILDWEMAGFWPTWWEYRKALYGFRSQPWWMYVLKETMTEYRAETEVDWDLEMF